MNRNGHSSSNRAGKSPLHRIGKSPNNRIGKSPMHRETAVQESQTRALDIGRSPTNHVRFAGKLSKKDWVCI